jgi:hypothetical protein
MVQTYKVRRYGAGEKAVDKLVSVRKIRVDATASSNQIEIARKTSFASSARRRQAREVLAQVPRKKDGKQAPQDVRQN